MANREYLSVRAAALRLGISPPTVVRRLHDGELEGAKVVTEAGHRRQVVTVASVEAALAAQEQGHGPRAA